MVTIQKTEPLRLASIVPSKVEMTKENNITWFQVNNIVPIVASAIMMSASFFMLKSDVALVKQDLSYIKANTEKMATVGEANSTLLNSHETRITLLERDSSRNQSVQTKPISLASKPTPTPEPHTYSSLRPSRSEDHSILAQEIESDSEKSSKKKPRPEASPTLIFEAVTKVVNEVLEPILPL